MKNKFDKLLTRKIEEVFNNQTFGYNPNNWEKMEQRLVRERNKKSFFYYSIGAAASLIILSGLLLYFNSIDSHSASNNMGKSYTINSSFENNSTQLHIKNYQEFKNKKFISTKNANKLDKTIVSSQVVSPVNFKNKSISKSKIFFNKNDSLDERFLTISFDKKDKEKYVEENKIVNTQQSKNIYKSFSLNKEISKIEKNSDGLIPSFLNEVNIEPKQRLNYKTKLFEKPDLNTGSSSSYHSIDLNVDVAKDFRSLTNLTLIDAGCDNIDIPSNEKYCLYYNKKRDLFLALEVSSQEQFSQDYQYESVILADNFNNGILAQESFAILNTYSFANDPISFSTFETNKTYSESGIKRLNSPSMNYSGNSSTNNFYLLRMVNISGNIIYNIGNSYNLVFAPFLKVPIGINTTELYKITSGGLSLQFNFGLGGYNYKNQ